MIDCDICFELGIVVRMVVVEVMVGSIVVVVVVSVVGVLCDDFGCAFLHGMFITLLCYVLKAPCVTLEVSRIFMLEFQLGSVICVLYAYVFTCMLVCMLVCDHGKGFVGCCRRLD